MQNSESNALPRYMKLANRLKQQINSGFFATGAKLPSQRELATQHETTLMTLRRALELLAEQGVVRIEHGVGTFVADQQLQESTFQLLNLRNELRQRALATETTTLAISHDVIHADAARAFGLSAETKLCLLQRLRTMGGTPFVLQASYLPPSFNQLVSGYINNESLYDLVQSATGQAVSSARELLKPIAPSTRQRELLSVDPGEAAWLSVRISSLHDGQPVIYDEAILRHDTLVVTVERSGAVAKSDLKWRDEQSPALISYLLDD